MLAGRALQFLTTPPRAVARRLAEAADLGPQRHGRHVSLGGRSGLVEVRGLAEADGDRRPLAGTVEAAVRGVRGVRWAQVNAVTGHVLLAFDGPRPDLGELLEAVESAEEEHGTADAGWSRASPPHPADRAALRSAVLALAADCAGLAAASVGRVVAVRPVPAAARVVVGLVEAQPWLRRLVETAVGPAGADLVIGIGGGVVNGLTAGVGPLLVTGVSHAQLVAEVRSRRAVWAAREAAMCAAPAALPEHPPLKVDRPRPFPAGPVEWFADRLAALSAATAGTVLALTRDPARAAAILLIGVPPAARLGREAFAATLARHLARRDVVPMDPGAFRRLDRISAVVLAPGTGDEAVLVVLGEDDDAVPTGETTFAAVRRLQEEGNGVLLLAPGGDDALAAADVAVAVHREDEPVGWAADLVCGPDPTAVGVLLAAVPVARRVSRRAVAVAAAGSATAAVLTAVAPWPASDLTLQPVYVSGLLTQLDGAIAARRLAVRAATRGGSRGGRRTGGRAAPG